MTRAQSWLTFATLLAVAVLAGSLIAGIAASPPQPEPESVTGKATGSPAVRVEVLNAGGEAGVARAATQVLRDRRFDVVFYGNAARFDLDSSVVLARTASAEPAQRVARALGISRVRTAPDSTLYLEVTVRLGRDWQPPDDLLPGLFRPPNSGS